jgi:16S rRNA (adenine1518-N6/adenine1519-N6)-dimethyltransferase
VIEKEQKLADHLKTTYEEFPFVHILHDDALVAEWPPYIKVVANLPYSISSPIIEKIVHHSVTDATIMLQREVGLRCLARPGSKDYSRLSILCQIHGITSRLMDVAPQSFFPTPEVSSIVIQFTKQDKSWENDHAELEELAMNLFSVKRRTLRKVVRRFLKRRDVAEEAWEKCPYKSERIFTLSVTQMDEILTHLKATQAWPLAQPVN